MNAITIRASGLTKTRGARRVLDSVDLALEHGQVTAILGPSGAGKSTLLRAVAGLEKLDSGTIEAGDQLLTDGEVLIRPEYRNIGMVFQDFSLFPHLSVLENVMFGLRGGTGHERKQRAFAMLEQVHLADRGSDYPHALSGGEQQRVALARALAPAPTTILLDEAFSGLDRTLRAELRDTALQAIATQGVAALMVTHDPLEAMYMADRLVLMIDGGIVQSGRPEDLYLNPISAQAARLLGEVNEWVGPIENGKVVTPFGAIDAIPSQMTGTVRVLVRPEGVSISRDANGTCTASAVHTLGPSLSVMVKPPASAPWMAKTALDSPVTEGDKLHVELDPHFCQITNME